MKTKFLQRVLWLMIPLLTLFNTQAWGETITLTQSALGLTGSYTTNTVKTVSDVDFTYTNLMKNNSDIQAKASSGTIYNSSLVPGKITKVQITHSGTARSTTIAMGTSTSNYTAGTYSGSGSIYLNGPANTCCGYFKITRGSSNAAYWTQVVVTYTPATITLSESSITGLNYAVGGGPSAAQTFTVSGSNIPANLTVTAPTNFEVSLDGSSWASSKTINVTLTGSASAGTLSSKTVYVRLASGKSAGNYSGNVSIAMAGCKTISSVNPKTVAVSGTVSAASYTVGWSITDGGGTLSTTSGMSTTVTPASGYRYASPAYTVLTGSATVVRSSNTFSATPTDNSTIRINMEQIPSHNIIFNTGGLVAIPSASVLEGATYDITEDPSASLSDGCEYSTFVGWTTASSIADPSVKPTIVTSVTMSTSDVTLYAVYSKTEGSGGEETYDKVTSTDDIEDGQYLVVCESQSVAFNGGLSTLDASSNTISVDISSNQIAVSSTTEDAEFTIDATNQTIQSASDYYIDRTSGTSGGALHTTTSNPQSHTFSIDNSGNFVDQASVTGTHSYLKYNANSGQERFRYYVTGQTDIQLYKKSSGTTTYSLSADCNKPTITVSTDDINFGDKKASSDRSISHTATFTVSGANLNEDIALSISGGEPTLFSVDKYTLEEDGGTVATTTITVTWTPSAASNQTDIHINSDGATEKIVHVHGTGKWEVTWMSHGGEHTTTLVASGTLPDFPAEDPTSCDLESSSFYGWSTAEWTGKLDNLAGKTVYTTNSGMATVSDNNRVYYAVFAKGTSSGSECYKKVTSTGSISNDGRYLIVYETGKVAFKGSLTSLDATDNTIDVTFDGSDITADATTKVNEFTIDVTNLYVKSASNRWINRDAYSNGLGNNTSATSVHSISIDGSGNLVIQGTGESSGSYVQLKYNANADQSRFRFYTSGQQDIQLYKYDPGVTYSKFLTNCCTSNDITLAGSGNISGAGTFSTDAASACEGATITLSTSICSGYTVGDWDVYKTGESSTKVSVTDNAFTMPAYGVTVALSTTIRQDHYIDKLHNSTGYTGTGALREGCSYSVPDDISNTTPGSGCENEHYVFVGWVDAGHVAADGSLLSGYSLFKGGTKDASGTTYYAIWAKVIE